MANNNTLNLLVIDGNQLYAERLVDLLSLYYDDVKLGFLDDKSELIKMLRRKWDVLVYGRAYDMKLTDIIGIVQEQGLDLPIIGLMSNEVAASGRNEEGLPKVIDSTLIKAINPEQETQVIACIRLQHQALQIRREMAKLRNIISEAEQRANILIKNSKSAVAYIDEGIHIFANDPYLKMFGYDSMDDLMGVPVIDLISGGDDIKEFKQFLRRFAKGNRDNVEFKFESKRSDGSTFAAKLQLAAATYDGEPVTQIIIQQNNSGVNTAEIAKKLAAAERQDALTGLENRRGFEERLQKALAYAKGGSTVAGLFYIRMDNLGKISSSLGIQGVDAATKHIANVLTEYFADDYVSRFSDSVFTVLTQDTDEEEMQKQAKELLERVDGMIIKVGKRSTGTTLSVGMALMDKQSPDHEVVLQRAVEAFSQVMVKTGNVGNDFLLYDPSEYASSDDGALAEYLNTAVSNNLFVLEYQPIYDIETDSSSLFEIYLGLNMSDGTRMSVPDFYPVAKANGLLQKIDRWLMINACKQLNEVRKQHPDTKVIVRLTADTLIDEQLPKIAGQLIKALGGDAGALTLQFTEQDVIDYLAVAKKQFNALSSLNCNICIHNFGSTAKSIEAVEYVQPTMVRLARNYVSDLSNPENLEIIKSLVSQVNERNVNVLMPYIEEASTMSAAWSVGARFLQGNYLQAPEGQMTFGE